MRLHSPASFGSFRIRYSPFDLFWAAVSPLLALYLRDAYILNSNDHFRLAALYCVVSFGCCMIAFLAFRLSDGISRYFSVYDALNVVKAVVASQLLTAVVMFTFTRLEGIPRSTPVVHLLVLAAGLLAARAMVLLRKPDRKVSPVPDHDTLEHAIIVGSSELSALYIKLLRAYPSGPRRIIAILDRNPKLIGRAIAGVPIVAPPENIGFVVDDFAVHGIRTDRIVIGGDAQLLPEDLLDEVRQFCAARNIEMDFVADLMGLTVGPSLAYDTQSSASPAGGSIKPARAPRPTITLPRYFQFKRMIDVFGALVAIVLLSPLFVLTALLVLIDVGSPLLFWQKRVGQGAASVLLYKFRTLRSAFDLHGNRLPESARMSWIGLLLRKLRLDELPQLFNVLVGDMSLIGPRPLLPVDQPANSRLRLAVRPGITGWAQINGGNLITPDEKGALDHYYIRNVSLRFDLYIVYLTLRFLFTGEKRSEQAVVEACAAEAQFLADQPMWRVRKFRDAGHAEGGKLLARKELAVNNS